MLFNSWQFAIFLPIVFALYWMLPHKYRWGIILASSYYFYASWNAKYLLLIIFITIISYVGGILADKNVGNEFKKKTVVTVVVTISLLILFIFKYFNFVAGTVYSILASMQITVPHYTSNLLLPVGISFYTFQAIAYLVDVSRGDIESERHIGKYAAFISFFPQLVAGPIERTRNLLPQLKRENFFSYDNAVYGMRLMLWGFFKKIVIADTMAIYVDSVYQDVGNRTGFARLLVIFFFAIQIYCDFSGYSDIARGTAKLFGIDLMENFKSPYFAASIKEFWRRWHISLSTWFKDYVYIPLGGNRCGNVRNNANLLVTFLTSGIWHGASWTYVIWGGCHGILQILEKEFGKIRFVKKIKIPKAIKVIVTFVLVCALWTVFRAASIRDAAYMCLLCFVDYSDFMTWITAGIHDLGIGGMNLVKVVSMILMLAVYDYVSLKKDVIDIIGRRPLLVRWCVYLAMVCLIFLWAPASSAEFIYFDF